MKEKKAKAIPKNGKQNKWRKKCDYF